MRRAAGRCTALVFVIAGVLVSREAAGAQAVDVTGAGSPRVAVFVDCPRTGNRYDVACDVDYLRVIAPLIGWTSVRGTSGVHLLVRETPGSAGAVIVEVSRLLVGGAGDTSTATITIPPGLAIGEARDRLSAMLIGGVAVEVARSVGWAGTMADGAPIKRPRPVAPTSLTQRSAPGWAFRLEGTADAFSQSAIRQTTLEISGSAQQIRTDRRLQLETAFSREALQLTRAAGATDIVTAAAGVYGRWVQRLTDHWSGAALATAYRSDFANTHLGLRAGAFVEWNAFPWAQQLRRSVTLGYGATAEHFRWQARSLYGLRTEYLPQHVLFASASARESWGSFSGKVKYSALQGDRRFANLQITLTPTINLSGGWEVVLFGSYGRIGNQRYLPLGAATAEEAITRQRALATRFEAVGQVGLSYSWGDVANSTVNRRLQSLIFRQL